MLGCFCCFENCGDILAPIFVKFPDCNNELALRDIYFHQLIRMVHNDPIHWDSY
jgi:hypothetical protein